MLGLIGLIIAVLSSKQRKDSLNIDIMLSPYSFLCPAAPPPTFSILESPLEPGLLTLQHRFHCIVMSQQDVNPVYWEWTMVIVSYDSANKQEHYKKPLHWANQPQQRTLEQWKCNGAMVDQCKQRGVLCHIGLVRDHGGHLVNLFFIFWEVLKSNIWLK